MKTRAAVAWEAKRDLEIEEVELDGPRQGEVLCRMVATGVCHTDAYTLSGIVDDYMKGDINIDELVSFNMPLEQINDAFHLMHEGKSIRSVVLY
jgi:Zn-dependent alcohol dehydrogenase